MLCSFAMNKQNDPSTLLVLRVSKWFFMCFLCVSAVTNFWQARSPYMPPIFATLSHIMSTINVLTALFLWLVYSRGSRWAAIAIGIIIIALLGLWLYIRYAVLQPPT